MEELRASQEIQNFDAVIVGSDQMWNPMWCSPKWNDIVFLDFLDKRIKRIAYAASFSVKEWFDDTSALKVGGLLKQFDSISVRETSGIDIVRSLSGVSAKVVLDPTLLWQGSFYHSLFEQCEQPTNPYVFKYVIESSTDGSLEDKVVREVCESFDIQNVLDDKIESSSLVGTVISRLGIRRKVPVGVWLTRLARADFVVTNSFHGTVFSILFHRPFVVVPLQGCRKGMNERIKTLLSGVGLEGRIVNSLNRSDFFNFRKSEIEWHAVSEKLAAKRKSACDFIGVALESK